MKYVIMSGRFETGTEEEKQGYIGLFGEEEIQYFFDLYFHWYNLVHEMGHCLVEQQNAKMSKVAEEMYVNSFAVSYYRFVGENDRLEELKARLEKILGRFPAPMPEGESFTGFYERIWNTDQINNVMIYGYFQFRSVLEALNAKKDLREALGEIGIELSAAEKVESECSNVGLNADCNQSKADIISDNAEYFLKLAQKNLEAMGVKVPEIRVELLDNPMVQCARSEEDS